MDKLSYYWSCLPIGKDNAITYPELCKMWNCSERTVRYILHDLSYYDDGDDNLILIRSSHGKGFYKTDNVVEIERYKKECMNRARHTFAPIKKINRVLNIDEKQLDIFDLLIEG